MFREDEIVGAILIHTIRPRQFSEADEVLLSLIANETAIAVESARQHEASVRRSRYLAALYQASKAITAEFGADRRKILDQIVRSAVEGITGIHGPKAILGTLHLYDSDNDELVLESIYPREDYENLVNKIGRPVKEFLRGKRPPGITGRTIQVKIPQLINDVNQDKDYVECAKDAQSELAVPLLNRRRVIGVLNVESAEVGAFDAEDKEALRALAELTVVALQNAKQLEELKSTRLVVGLQRALTWKGIGNAMLGHKMNRFIGGAQAELALLEGELLAVGTGGDTLLRRLMSIQAKMEKAAEWSKEVAGEAGRTNALVYINKALQAWMKSRLLFETSVEYLPQFSLDDSVRCRLSAGLLREVLDILADNAEKATIGRSERIITIGSSLVGSRVEISVSDNGFGISPELQEKIFREEIKESKSSKAGLGMGLLMAYAITQRLNASIRLEGTSSRGTTFVISFPVPKQSRQRSPKPSNGEG